MAQARGRSVVGVRSESLELRFALPATPRPGRVGGQREGRGGAGPPPCSFHSHSQGLTPRPQHNPPAASELRRPRP